VLFFDFLTFFLIFLNFCKKFIFFILKKIPTCQAHIMRIERRYIDKERMLDEYWKRLGNCDERDGEN